MRAGPLALVVLTLVVAACGGSGATAAASPSDPPSPGASASTELVADIDVGGRTMHIVCVGPTDTGGPTILLEAGGGLGYDSWGEVLPSLLSTHRVCAYDRAGIGGSAPPVEPSRTAVDQVADLRALLDAAGIDGPFVVGAHSFGAVIATLFTEAYPDDVVGLVFVDPQAPRISAGWRAALPPPTADEPKTVAEFRDELDTFEVDPSLNPQHVRLRDSMALATAALDEAGPLFGDRPVIVLQAERTPRGWGALPSDLAAQFTSIWAAGQQELADESTAGSLDVVPGVGHNIQVEDAPAVVDALERVLATAATP